MTKEKVKIAKRRLGLLFARKRGDANDVHQYAISLLTDKKSRSSLNTYNK